MKTIALIAMSVVGTTSAFAQLWDQSDLVNNPGGGTGAIAGANLSQLETGETTFGYGAQQVSNNVMADDFTVGSGGWVINKLTFWTYQTGATAPSITAVNWAIGSTATTSLTNTAVTATFENIYRTNLGDTTSSNRRLQKVEVTGLNIALGAGTYFVSYNFAGTLASGPWAPPLPTSNAVFGQNALQSLAGGAFAPVLQGPAGADMAFQVHGTAVPEPATMAALGLGVAALIRRRRK